MSRSLDPSELCLIDALFFIASPTSGSCTLSLHDALPIWPAMVENCRSSGVATDEAMVSGLAPGRSEEHTSELQSHSDLVCRLLLEKKNDKKALSDLDFRLSNDTKNCT